MKKIYSIIAVFVAGTVMAQTYNYDSTNKALEISGDGSSTTKVLSTSIAPGGTIPGSSSTFGETTTVTLKDITAMVNPGSTNAIAPVSSTNSVSLKLVNATLTTRSAIDGSGHPQTIIIDENSKLRLIGNTSLLQGTDRIQNNGHIEQSVLGINNDVYLWASKGKSSGVGCSGILGGTGKITHTSPGTTVTTTNSTGLISYDKEISDLKITGDYTVDMDNVVTRSNGFVAGINTATGQTDLKMDLTGSLTVNAEQATAIGILANSMGDSLGVRTAKDFSGTLTVKGKKAYGIKLVGNSATTPSGFIQDATSGDIGNIKIGALNVTGIGDSATGIFANIIRQELSAENITVNGVNSAKGIQLTNGTDIDRGKLIKIDNLTVNATASTSSGADNSIAYGILSGTTSETTGSYVANGSIEELYLSNLNVSAGAAAYGIIAIDMSDTSNGYLGDITVVATEGTAYGIKVDWANINVTGNITATGATLASGITAEDLYLGLLDGASITATTTGENATECSAIHVTNNFLIRKGPNATETVNATFTGDVFATNMEIASGINLTVNGNVYSNVSGEGANSFTKSFYKIDALDVGGLVGTHNPSASENQIQGTLSDTTISGGSLTGSFTNGDTASGTALSWEITENTYFQDQSTTAKEKQIAKIVDSVAYTGDSATDTTNVAKKQTLAAAMAAGLGMSALDMSTVAKTAYENAALAEDIYWDTFFRAGRLMDTWQGEGDELNAKLPKRFRNARMQSWEVSVRTINRFGTAGGETDGDEYDYNTYGGMAQVDKQLGDLLIGGGVGGWFSKTKDGAAGKADSDIIAVTLYADWNFGYNFDWFGEIYYGRAMNTLKKPGIGGDISADWDANLIGGFTAIRYNWQVMDTVSIKPFAGVMLAYNMQDSLDADAAKVDAKDYTNCKGVVGVEAAWQPIKNLYLSGRVMYGYEFADCKYDVSTEVLGWGKTSYTGYETSRSSIIAGIGVNYQFLTNWNVGVSYNAEFRSSKLNNNINASVGYKF